MSSNYTDPLVYFAPQITALAERITRLTPLEGWPDGAAEYRLDGFWSILINHGQDTIITNCCGASGEKEPLALPPGVIVLLFAGIVLGSFGSGINFLMGDNHRLEGLNTTLTVVNRIKDPELFSYGQLQPVHVEKVSA